MEFFFDLIGRFERKNEIFEISEDNFFSSSIIVKFCIFYTEDWLI